MVYIIAQLTARSISATVWKLSVATLIVFYCGAGTYSVMGQSYSVLRFRCTYSSCNGDLDQFMVYGIF